MLSQPTKCPVNKNLLRNRVDTLCKLSKKFANLTHPPKMAISRRYVPKALIDTLNCDLDLSSSNDSYSNYIQIPVRVSCLINITCNCPVKACQREGGAIKKKKGGNKEYSRQLIVEIIDRENGIRIMNKIVSVLFFFLYSATLNFKWVIQRTNSGYCTFLYFCYDFTTFHFSHCIYI